MCVKSYDSENFHRVVKQLNSVSSFIVLTHARPDGDGLGSMLALAYAGRAAGKKVQMALPDAVPARYQFLFEQESADEPLLDEDEFSRVVDDFELIVVVDTHALSQLDEIGQVIIDRGDKVIVIDHHPTGDEIGQLQWIDSSMAAVGMMVAKIIDALHWPFDGVVATAVFTAVASDTGWFRFSNTDAEALRVAADMIDRGAKVTDIYTQLYQSDRPERLKLLQRMLASLELYHQDELAVMMLRKDDFLQSGATFDETENLINEALRLKTVLLAVLLIEQDGYVRVSLRGRIGVNVARIASRFGGGGHAQAAGLTIKEDIDTAKELIISACEQELDKRSGEAEI